MKRALKLIVALSLTTITYLIYKGLLINTFFSQINNSEYFKSTFIISLGMLICFLIYYIALAPFITKKIMLKIISVEANAEEMSFQEIVLCSGGIITGLIIANLLGILFIQFGFLGALIVCALNIFFGYLGFKVSKRKNKDVQLFEKCDNSNNAKPKILDTSVIIDGRILDILRTGFIEGKIIIPQFVLAELRHVADSSDTLKRNRGRRGLDILNEIQKQLDVPVETIEKDYKNITEVDSKILKLAEDLGASIVTNDFNLNKVADFKGVLVLNINELSNAIKPIVLPGEDMTVTVIKDGKEHDQGIGYLNDGTMIVIEGGRKAIGQTVDVLVTSVLQTAAGRMIFTKVK